MDGREVESVKNQEGFGFIESLVALAVAGIASVALLALAASILREAKQNEIRDAMSQQALDGMEQIRNIASIDPEDVPDTGYYCLENDDECDHQAGQGGFVTINAPDRCSQGGDDCGQLKLPSGENDDYFFYREVDIVDHGDAAKVTVRVGMLNPPDSWEGTARSESQIVGFISR